MPTIIRRNARSWAISMISDINIKLQSLNLRIIRAGGEFFKALGYYYKIEQILATNKKNFFIDKKIILWYYNIRFI